MALAPEASVAATPQPHDPRRSQAPMDHPSVVSIAPKAAYVQRPSPLRSQGSQAQVANQRPSLLQASAETWATIKAATAPTQVAIWAKAIWAKAT